MSKVFTKSFTNKVLAVSGFTRSGKAMLMKLISTFENVEKSYTDVSLEQIYYLFKLKKIKYETASYLLRKSLNIIQFYNFIGRNVNFKNQDFSSIANYHNPNFYVRRVKSKTNKIEEIPKQYLFQIMLHSGLNSGELILSSLKYLNIIEVIKNPLELVYSWIKEDYGKLSIYKKVNIYILTIKYKNHIFPYYASGWEDEFLRMNQYERCANMILKLYNERDKEINNLSVNQKKRILFVNFDDLVSQPQKIMFKISKFINRKIGKKTFFEFKNQKIPRKIFDVSYNEKVRFLKKKLSRKTFLKLIDCETKYLKTINYEKKLS